MKEAALSGSLALYIRYLQITLYTVGDDLNLDVERPRVVIEVSFVNTEEESSVSCCGKFSRCSDINEIVIVVTYNGDQRPCRNIFQQLLCILDRRVAAG